MQYPLQCGVKYEELSRIVEMHSSHNTLTYTRHWVDDAMSPLRPVSATQLTLHKGDI